MSARTGSNYPDILGAITGKPRCNVNIVQLALAVRPRMVRAGSPFEVILLLQNASDADVDVTVTLRLPDRDAKKQKAPFTSSHTRLLVGLRPAEVGYVTLPVMCAPTTTPYETYKVSVRVQVKPLTKPQRIRHPEGGGRITGLNERLRAIIMDLRKLNFSVEKQFGLGDTLEVSFGVLPEEPEIVQLTRAGWISLWTIADHTDYAEAFATFSPMLGEFVLPLLQPKKTVPLLQEVTEAYFENAGYRLKPIEALLIAKMLAQVLQLAHPTSHVHDYDADPIYNVERTIKVQALSGKPVRLPYWCAGMLQVISTNREALYQPVEVISQMLYDHLVRDAVPLAIQMIQQVTGFELGTPDEARSYADRIVRLLHEHKGINFDYAYVPLVLGGLIVNNQVAGPNERLDDIMHQIHQALRERRREKNEQNAAIFKLTDELIEICAQQFKVM